MLALLAVLGARAQSPPLSSAELSVPLQETAHTLPAQTFRLQLLGTSAYAPTSSLELKAAPLGVLLGPTLSAEQALPLPPGHALSLTARLGSPWTFRALQADLIARYTLGQADAPNLTVALGGGIRQDGQRLLPVGLGGNLPAGEDHIFSLNFLVDPLLSEQEGRLEGRAGLSWTHGWNRRRIQAGVVMRPTTPVQRALDEALKPYGARINLPRWVPLPTLRLWWLF